MSISTLNQWILPQAVLDEWVLVFHCLLQVPLPNFAENGLFLHKSQNKLLHHLSALLRRPNAHQFQYRDSNYWLFDRCKQGLYFRLGRSSWNRATPKSLLVIVRTRIRRSGCSWLRKFWKSWPKPWMQRGLR